MQAVLLLVAAVLAWPCEFALAVWQGGKVGPAEASASPVALARPGQAQSKHNPAPRVSEDVTAADCYDQDQIDDDGPSPGSFLHGPTAADHATPLAPWLLGSCGRSISGADLASLCRLRC
jgi:hypothetical protein